LAEIGTPAVEPLIAALKGSDNYALFRVAGLLFRFGEARAVEPLVVAFVEALKGGNSDTQRAASGALIKIGRPAVERLVAVLNDSHVRSRAEQGQGSFWSSDAPDRKFSRVFEEAARALGEIGDASAVEPLIAALIDHDLGALRAAAAGALAKIGDARAVEPLIAVFGGWHWPDDSREMVCKAAAGALAKIGDVRAVGPLIAMLKDYRMCWEAAEALVQIGSAAVEPLIPRLNDGDAGVRKVAASVLGKIGDARAVGPLIAALKDSDSKVRLAATEALDKRGWRPSQDGYM